MINEIYLRHYNHLMKSHLYKELLDNKLIIPHCQIWDNTIVPDKVKFISYPYEWCFSQLKDVALATLEIQERAMEHNMILKDASAYNIQFYNGKPTLIDTLSFEIYESGKPWVAYRQFCQHFLAPLMLMAYKDIRLGKLSQVFLDGIPVDLAYELLPFRAKHNQHIYFQTIGQGYVANNSIDTGKCSVSRNSLVKLIKNLRKTVESLNWSPKSSEGWDRYYEPDYISYTPIALKSKHKIIESWIEEIPYRINMVWDLGSNDGTFSRIASSRYIHTISFDYDYAVIENSYQEWCKEKRDKYLLPLVLDLTNPSPAIGWSNKERQSLIDRSPVDLVMALALVHHLAIANNVPLEMIAELFSKLGKILIVEFVPKSSPQVQRLLSTRQDIFDKYSKKHFELAFNNYFTIKKVQPITESDRILYLMEKR